MGDFVDRYQLRRIGAPDIVKVGTGSVPVGYLGTDLKEYWSHAPDESSSIVVGPEAGSPEIAKKALESYLREQGFENIEERNGRIVASGGDRRLELFFNGKTRNGSYQYNIDFTNSRL